MDWDQWIQQHAPDGGFLQSTGWAEFQRGIGRRAEYIQLRVTSDELRTLAVEQQLPLGQTYVYSPRGPVSGLPRHPDPWSGLLAMTNQIRKKFPKAIFWRIEPSINLQLTAYDLRRVKFVQPATTLIVDLSKTEEELLAQMKQKTRYNIKVAQRHSVRVSVSSEQETVNRFLNLLEETAKRDGFRTHARGYYQKLLNLNQRHAELVSASPEIPKQVRDDGSLDVELFCAFHKDQLLAGAIVAFFGKWAYYLHGASSNEHREMMAPYVLHWEIMREAKRRGCTKYDLWGAGDEWPGVSKFKTGFAPATALTHYPGTFDVVLKPWKYWVYRMFHRLHSG